MDKPAHAEQHRSYYYSTAAKDSRYRRLGLENASFSRKDNLQHFLRRLQTKFIATGLDTITYVRDPMTNKEDMVSVLTDYPRLDLDTVKKSSAVLVPKYDEFDMNTTGNGCSRSTPPES